MWNAVSREQEKMTRQATSNTVGVDAGHDENEVTTCMYSSSMIMTGVTFTFTLFGTKW